MKKNYWKMNLRTVTRSLSRFLAIFAITALGVGFLTGLLCTAPDMKQSVDRYYDDAHFMDIDIKSTLGLTEEDLAAVRETQGVRGVAAAYTADVEALWEKSGETGAAKVTAVDFSSPESSSVNSLTLSEGRLPEREGECVQVIENPYSSYASLGDTITLLPEEKEEDLYRERTLTVVGLVTSPLYVSTERESSSVGNGTAAWFFYVDAQELDTDLFTDLYVTLEGAEALSAFSEEYGELRENGITRLKNLAVVRQEARFDSLQGEAESAVSEAEEDYLSEKEDAEQELSDAEQELADARTELTDAETSYAEGEAELNTVRDELTDAETSYADGEAELAAAQKELEEGEKAYADGEAELAAAQEELEEGEKAYADGAAKLSEAQEELQEGEKACADGAAELAAAQDELEEGEKAYADGAAELAAAQEELEEGEKTLLASQAELEAAETELSAARDELDAGWEQLNEEKEQLDEAAASIEELKDWVSISTEASEAVAAYDAAVAAYEAGLASLTEAEETYAEQWETYCEGSAAAIAAGETLEQSRAELESGIAELTESRKTLDEGWAQLTEGWTELEESRKKLEEGRAEFEEGWTELTESRKTLDEGWEELTEGRTELTESRKTLDEGWEELTEARTELEENRETLDEGWEELEEGEREWENAGQELGNGRDEYEEGWSAWKQSRRKADEKFAGAEGEIAEARQEAEEIEYPKWYVLDRESNVSYYSFVSNVDKVSDIAKVFPVFFFLVAALVALTTMTRMVEEERTQIGVMKALGYSRGAIAVRYLLYAGTASVLGALAGTLIGQWLFPTAIWSAYSIMYYYTGFTAGFLPQFAVPSALISIVSVLAATLAAVLGTLMDCPARLILPKAPKPGKRIFLDHLPFLWNRLKFTYKVTARNILRYKQRFIMTIVGIAGCTALLVAGFGIRDSIGNVVSIQFNDIQKYNLTVTLREDRDEEEEERLEALWRERGEDTLNLYYERLTVSKGDVSEDIYVEVPEESDRLSEFVELRERVGKEPVPFDEDAVLLTEKLADTLGVGIGDKVTLENEEGTEASFRLTGITENYIWGYMYIGKSAWIRAYGEAEDPLTWIVKSDAQGTAAEDAEAEEILAYSFVSSAQFFTGTVTTFNNMLDKIDYIVILLILCAGLLAFVVLYNLISINIGERQREIATIKVLGFYHREVNAYIFRETFLLSFLGSLAGLAVGFFLHRFIILTVEVSNIMFGRDIRPSSFLISIAITLAFTVLVSLFMSRKLRKISMVESLKSVD